MRTITYNHPGIGPVEAFPMTRQAAADTHFVDPQQGPPDLDLCVTGPMVRGVLFKGHGRQAERGLDVVVNAQADFSAVVNVDESKDGARWFTVAGFELTPGQGLGYRFTPQRGFYRVRCGVKVGCSDGSLSVVSQARK